MAAAAADCASDEVLVVVWAVVLGLVAEEHGVFDCLLADMLMSSG